MKLVSRLSVVQAEITFSKIFLVPFRPAKYESLIIGTGGMERDQVKNE